MSRYWVLSTLLLFSPLPAIEIQSVLSDWRHEVITHELEALEGVDHLAQRLKSYGESIQ